MDLGKTRKDGPQQILILGNGSFSYFVELFYEPSASLSREIIKAYI